jgi:predicted ABC-class ATPase
MEVLMLRPISDLQRKLQRLDGQLFEKYGEIAGAYETANLRLEIDHVQSDPFAIATRVQIFVACKKAKFPQEWLTNAEMRPALLDFLARQLHYESAKFSRNRGSGRSGEIQVTEPGPQIIDRSSLLLHGDVELEARIFVGLPASGKHITGHIAIEMLCQDIPRIIEKTLFYASLQQRKIKRHMDLFADAEAVRKWLAETGNVAFIAEDAVLLRSLESDKAANNATPFSGTGEQFTELQLPHRGKVRGLVIGPGLTFISGPADSGKSVLFEAICQGVYNHIPGDGRGLVVSKGNAICIKAEAKRHAHSIETSHIGAAGKINLRGLPQSNASRQSQYASLMEAIELGASPLLIDENLCSAEFLYDGNYESGLKSLYHLCPDLKASGMAILVVSRALPAFGQIADQVITCATDFKVHSESGPGCPVGQKISLSQRAPNARTIIPKKGHRPVLIASRDNAVLLFGKLEVELSALSGIVEQGQLDAIGQAINYARKRLMGEGYGLKNIAARVTADIAKQGWQSIDNRKMGIYVAFRSIDFAMVLNRLPEMEML